VELEGEVVPQAAASDAATAGARPTMPEPNGILRIPFFIISLLTAFLWRGWLACRHTRRPPRTVRGRPCRQLASKVLMVSPCEFVTRKPGSGTAASAHEDRELTARVMAQAAALANQLLASGVSVTALSYKTGQRDPTPDAIYASNWFSTHSADECGEPTLVLYPMSTADRRKERRPRFVSSLRKQYMKVVDLTACERLSDFLEGKGSLILDKRYRRAYVCLSEKSSRTAAEVCAGTLPLAFPPTTCVFHHLTLVSLFSIAVIICFSCGHAVLLMS
jgi:hypothetical protein